MDNINNMTVVQLRKYAAANGIPIKEKNKPKILAEIEEALNRRAAEVGAGAAAAPEEKPADTPENVTGISGDAPAASTEPPETGAGTHGTTAAPDAPQGAQSGAQDNKGAFTINRVLRVTKPLVKGDDVKAIQEALIANHLQCGVDGANGIYNAATAYAVRMFQALNRLIVSGKVERFTAQALGAKWIEPTAPPKATQT
jgi:hypothetical protein